MNAGKTSRDEHDLSEHDGPDDIERYIATFTEDERHGLAAAEAAIDIAILLHRVREQRGLNQGAAAKLAGLHQTSVGWPPQRLQDSVAGIRLALRLERPRHLQFDRVTGTDSEHDSGCLESGIHLNCM